MSEAALQRLDDAQAALIAALDGHDIDALAAATATLARAAEALAAAGAWHARTDLREGVQHALGRSHAARGRVNALADRNRRRLDTLVGLLGQPRAHAYARSGKLR